MRFLEGWFSGRQETSALGVEERLDAAVVALTNATDSELGTTGEVFAAMVDRIAV